jgi:hypothetical protein
VQLELLLLVLGLLLLLLPRLLRLITWLLTAALRTFLILYVLGLLVKLLG